MIDELKRLLRTHHPFTLVLYLTVVTIATVLLFNMGKEFAGISADSSQRPSEGQKQIQTEGLPNAWELPPFSLQDTEGVAHSLDEWRGQVILLNFWATWCPPCKYEIPDFMEYQADYAESGFQIVGIGIDDADSIKNYYDEMGMNYPVLIATDSAMMAQWGNREQVLPYSVVIDRDGEIRYIHRGQLDPPVFEATIKPLIEQQ